MTEHLFDTSNIPRQPYDYCACSETNRRENNEDSFQLFALSYALERPPLVVLAVADGMGGHAYGEHVSREALRKLSLALFEQLTTEMTLNRLPDPALEVGALARAMANAVEQTHTQVLRMVKANNWGKAGSTLVAVAILEDTAVVVNLGDSPLFHYRTSDGQLARVTEDHSVAGVLLRANLITPEMARAHEGRSRLEFFLGCENLPKEVPVGKVSLSPGDLLLLCSDGVSGPLADDQIARALRDAGEDLEVTAARLTRMARDAGETDNQTLILWRHPRRQKQTDDEHPPLTQLLGSSP